MTTNADLAEIFRSVADILDLQGERFKPEAYRRAARSIETLAEDIRRVAARGELRSIPGVGEAIAEKVREYLKTGRIGYSDRLRTEVPAGILEIMRLPGVGPKTARRFWVEFGFEGPQELQAAIAAGRLAGAAGFGEKKIAQLSAALEAGRPPEGRLPLADAWRLARRLTTALAGRAPVDRIEVAGSLRRRRESVGDLDLLVTTRSPEAVLDAFVALEGVGPVRLRGPTKTTVLVDGRVQVDLRVMDPAAFGAALQYFTGSKDHNVHLRTLARDRGLKVNEYGVFRGDDRVAGATEEEVYAALGLAWIPPEIREDRGEIELAQSRRLPVLVAPTDLRGEYHVHVDGSTSDADLDRLLASAAQRGWEFLGFVLPETRSAGTDRVVEAIRSRRTPAPGRARALLGREVPLDAPAPSGGADFWLASARGVGLPPAEAGLGDPLAIVHLALAPPGAEPPAEAIGAWVDWARDRGRPLEVTPRAAADGLDAGGIRRAATEGVRLHLTAGIVGPADPLDAIDLAIGLARRGYLPPASTVNHGPGAGAPTSPSTPTPRTRGRTARPR